MDRHITDWIGAYLDGELYGARLESVERHLKGCPECREELEGIGKLSILLHDAPAVQPKRTPERFASQVKLLLPHTSARSPWSRFMELSWRAAPLLLIGLWAFTQVVLLFSGFLSLGISSTGQGLPEIDFLPGLMPFPYALLNEFGTALLDASIFEGFGNFVFESGFLELTAVSVLVTATAAALLWSWLASWLAFSRRSMNTAVTAEITRA